MNDMTTMIKAVADIEDDILTQNFTSFIESISNSGYFFVDTACLNINKDIGTVTIELSRQQMIKDITDYLVKLLDVNVLYYVKSSEGKVVKVLTYTRPFFDEMYIIGMESQQYGIIENIKVTFFESMEKMFFMLLRNLRIVTSSEQEFITLQPSIELYRNFM